MPFHAATWQLNSISEIWHAGVRNSDYSLAIRVRGRADRCIVYRYYTDIKKDGGKVARHRCDYDIEICFTGFTLASSFLGTVI